ncbi:restriction endonuclease subunit S [Mammaliicoccus sciuri]|uniref:restriction endonuclease subunit S n=1 Tax=Mammaliicoccus sciuri TaxID=1296 RepID=UPI001EF74EC7|nr:restriction endonuclease subunit S [Mammaliicoccus sciuri]
MMKLSDREWKVFVLEELFTVSGTKTTPLILLKKNEKNQDKQLPYVTTKSTYNGIDNFFSNYTEEGNVITIDSATDGYVFYQLNKFSASDHVEKLIPKFKLNKYIALFIVNSIKKATKNKYGYGYKFSQTRIKRQKIMLPVSNNQPDYDFMEQYIKEKYFNLKSQIKEKQKYEITDWRELDEVEWGPFKMTDIFDNIQRGKRLTKSNQVKGNRPYISSSGIYNGVNNFIANTRNIRQFENSLTLANSGSVGKTFYQPFQYIASDHVTNLKKENSNKFIYLFMCNLISRLSDKYSFNREINDFRIRRETLLLPVLNGLPDYLFMEQYMKRKENEILDRL